MTAGIDEAAVTDWLRAHVPALAPPVDYSLLAGGHSNLTFRCEDSAGHVYVLRRPPLGAVLASAHDMGREHRIIDALKDSVVPVADNFGLCADKSVNTADFFVMEFIDGVVLNDSLQANQLSEDDRQSISKDVAEILCRLHAIDPDEVGLGDLGRKEAYLARQMKLWIRQWEASKTHEVPEVDEGRRILEEKMPEQVAAAIVHGDYRLGNMIVGDGRVKAVLDWELCTLGDPLADVGFILNNWVPKEEALEPGKDDHTPTAAGGFISRDEFIAVYETNTGWDLSNINYYRAFSNWRLVAIEQGVYKRYLDGAMGEGHGMDLDRLKANVKTRAVAALELLHSE